ncbi:MAG: hypothetical protein R3A13_01125 [Bdellovibrionota bacterium]
MLVAKGGRCWGVGGTGLYRQWCDLIEKFSIDTPFGAPSGELSLAHLGDKQV